MIVKYYSMKYEKVRLTIAIKIKNMREDAGLNQRELSAKSGVSQKTISNLEDPESHSCQLDKLQAIATAFNIELWELIKSDDLRVLEKHNGNVTAQASDGLTDEAIDFARAFQELPSEQRAVLESTAKAFMDSTKKQDKKNIA